MACTHCHSPVLSRKVHGRVSCLQSSPAHEHVVHGRPVPRQRIRVLAGHAARDDRTPADGHVVVVHVVHVADAGQVVEHVAEVVVVLHDLVHDLVHGIVHGIVRNARAPASCRDLAQRAAALRAREHRKAHVAPQRGRRLLHARHGLLHVNLLLRELELCECQPLGLRELELRECHPRMRGLLNDLDEGLQGLDLLAHDHLPLHDLGRTRQTWQERTRQTWQEQHKSAIENSHKMDDMQITFRLYSEEEMLRLSVVRVVSASTYDHGLPKTGGLMDSRMGSTDRSILCRTCHTPSCAGHYGHMLLPCRVLLPGHIKRVVSLLRCVCNCCCTPLFGDECLSITSSERLKSVSETCRRVKACSACNFPVPEILETNRIFIERKWSTEQLAGMDPEEREHVTQRFVPDEIYSIFNAISTATLLRLGMSPGTSHPRDTVPRVILVLPPAQRPTLRIADGGKSKGEDDLTSLYQDIIRAIVEYEGGAPKKPRKTEPDAYGKLQLFVACLVKNALRKTVDVRGVVDHSAARGVVRTLRDLDHRLSGKKGRLRGTLNAKRTDFSARTVVGIDMTHDIWQLGVPESRMKILTFPERVNSLNMEVLRERVINGPNANGAANIIQPISGGEDRIILLTLMTLEERIAAAATLQVGWIVERHLRNGDWVLFNRQPTLHKMSIQAFEIYGVPGLTFRLPLPVTRPFNADYDGDEMNMHVPQSLDAVAEAQTLMAVPYNMVSPSSTAAIISPVQETLVAWFRLTSRNTILTKDVFMQLKTQISYDPLANDYAERPSCTSLGMSCPIPAIIKSPSGPRWTGKQIMGCLLPPTITSTRAVRDGAIGSSWLGHKEDIVVISRGELLAGRVCKATLGSGTSLVHTLWKDVGPWAAAKFVSDVQRVGNAWNSFESPCISIRDCIVPNEIEAQVDTLVSDAMGYAHALQGLDVPPDIKEGRMQSILQDVLRTAGSLVLKSLDTSSALAAVVVSGAKGNALNLSQIAAVVGQQTIGGRRVVSRAARLGPRTLICFPPGDTRPEASGFVATSYLAGQTEDEFFHCMMAGREGIVATATDTATAGYNTRKMVKIQEGQIVAQDRTVRVTASEVVTMHYGGDDYDATRVESAKIPLLRVPRTMLMDELLETAQSCLRALCRPALPGEYPSSVTVPFSPSRLHDECVQIKDARHISRARHREWIDTLCKAIASAHGILDITLLPALRATSVRDDGTWRKTACVVILTWPWDACVSFSEAHLVFLATKIIQRVNTALISPGEAVGTIGGTSIGEPSTQGALNVFHFSGIAEKNALAGMPRFKQIINATRSSETSMMTFLGADAALAVTLKAVNLSFILTSVNILLSSQPSDLQAREAAFLPVASGWARTLDVLPKSLQTSVAHIVAAVSAPHTIHYTLNKRVCIEESVTPSMVRDRLRRILGSSVLVLSSETFEAEWAVRVHPFNASHFCVGGQFDSRAVCEAIVDSLRFACTIKGISEINDSFVSKTIVDSIGPDGAIVRGPVVRVGTLGSSLLAASWLTSDPSRAWTNDILETAECLGIEAATMLNHMELQRVISFDSTHVDARHTLLLSETMTRRGAVAALNRHKMKDLGSSLLSRASFEQTLPVLEDAAFFSNMDALEGSLERQIVGLPLRLGTGAVHILPQWKAPVEDVVMIAPLSRTKPQQFIAPLGPLFGTGIAPLWDLGWTPHVSAPFDASLDTFASVCRPLAEAWWKSVSSGVMGILRGRLATTPVSFSRTLAKLESYHGWDDPECFWIQTTRAEWTHENQRAFSIITYPSDPTITKPDRLHIIKSLASSVRVHMNTSAEILFWTVTQLHPSFVPASMVPTQVTLRQRKSFVRDGWVVKFTKTWRAPTLLEAEALLVSTAPELSICIDAIHSGAALHPLPVHETLVTKLQSM